MLDFRKYIFVITASVVFSSLASACPVCYGASDSAAVDGMNKAILTMLSITGFVLTGVTSFFFMMRKKIKSQKSQTPFVDKQGNLQWNNY